MLERFAKLILMLLLMPFWIVGWVGGTILEIGVLIYATLLEGFAARYRP